MAALMTERDVPTIEAARARGWCTSPRSLPGNSRASGAVGTPRYRPGGRTRERHILERAVQTVAEQAQVADDHVDRAMTADREEVILEAKRLRLVLLNVKTDLERELATWSPNCQECSLDVHWVAGLGVTPGHRSHAEPAPQGEPTVLNLLGPRPRGSF
jgi:hypothetical protein